jgi:hypothetical protein
LASTSEGMNCHFMGKEFEKPPVNNFAPRSHQNKSLTDRIVKVTPLEDVHQGGIEIENDEEGKQHTTRHPFCILFCLLLFCSHHQSLLFRSPPSKSIILEEWECPPNSLARRYHSPRTVSLLLFLNRRNKFPFLLCFLSCFFFFLFA